ncbi:MAG: sulfurtransferase TusA family protein [Thermomicrobiales bacterium]
MSATTGVTIDKEIDARGSFCPGPLLELIRGVKSVDAGQVLAVLSSDPGSSKDIPAWVAKAKHEMIGIDEEPDYKRFVIRKSH